MDPNLLQQIRDSILGTTLASEKRGGLHSSIYLQEIRDAILSVTGGVFGNLNEAIYLQQIRDAVLGVTAAPGTYGCLNSVIYLQQIRDAILGVTSNPQGGLDEGIYLGEISSIVGAGGIHIDFLLQDDFLTDRAAGAVTATAAEPGGMGGATLNTRTVTDTESKVTIANDWLVFAGGKATPAHGDPRLSYGTSARTVGRVATWCARVNQRNKDCYVGLNISNTQNPIRAHAINFTSGSRIALYDNNGGDTTLYKSYQPYAEYLVAILQRANGATYLVRGCVPDYPTWTLLKTTALNSAANLFVQVNNHSAAFSVKSVRLTSTLLTTYIDTSNYSVLSRCVPSFSSRYMFAVGDSRTVAAQGDNKWVGLLTRYSQGTEWLECAARVAAGGWKVADVQAALPAALAAATIDPEFVWIDIGINDNGITAEADFKASLLAVLDAIHTKWANTPIYVDEVAKLTVDTTTINTWIDYCIAQRSTFTSLGTDERTYAAGNMQPDNVHFTDAGYYVKANAILTRLGYPTGA